MTHLGIEFDTEQEAIDAVEASKTIISYIFKNNKYYLIIP